MTAVASVMAYSRRLPSLALTSLWVLAVFSPVLLLTAESAAETLRNPELLALALPTGRRLGLLVNSLGLSAAVSLSAVVVGLLAGSVLWEWDAGPWSRLRWLPLALVPVPPYIHALSWMTALDWLGVSAAGWAPTFLVEFMAYLPLGLGLSLIGYMGVDASMVEAARLHRPDGDVFTRVVVPLVAPALVAAGGLVFAFTVTDYSVPTLFSVNVYSLEVFSDFSASNQAARSMMLSVPILLATMLALWASQSSLRSVVQSDASNRPAPRLSYPAWLGSLRLVGLGVACAQALVLAVTLVSASGGLGSVVYAVSSAHGDIGFTLFQAAATAALCVPLAFVAADHMRRGSGPWWLMAVAPLAVPSPLVGISVLRLAGASGLLYGSWAAPVLGTVVRFTPVASLAALAQLKRLDPLLLDAADLFGGAPGRALSRVRLPLQAPGLAAAAALVFAFTMGEMGATLLTVPPGVSTVTIRVFNYLHYGGSDVVAGLCLVMVAAMVAAGLIGLTAFSLRRGSGGRGE